MKTLSAQEVLKNVEACITELENVDKSIFMSDRYHVSVKSWATGEKNFSFKMDAVWDELNIFDCFKNNLTMSDLKVMRSFLKEAIKLGFNGYACFKVGASGCANGMWAHELESTDGFSPKGGKCLYRSFTPDYVCYDVDLGKGFTGKGFKTVRALERYINNTKEA